MSIFMRGEKQILLNMFGIKYGYVIVENYPISVIASMDAGRELLTVMVGKGDITSDEAKNFEALLLEVGVLSTFKDICTLVGKFEPPKNYSPIFDFQVCNSCDLLFPHGYVVNTLTGGRYFPPFACLTDGLMVLNADVNRVEIPPLDGAIVFHKMTESGIAIDSKDFSEKLQTLSVDPASFAHQIFSSQKKRDKKEDCYKS